LSLASAVRTLVGRLTAEVSTHRSGRPAPGAGHPSPDTRSEQQVT